MAFTSGFLRDDSLIENDAGCELIIRLPWMRALPWSSLVELTLSFDGVPVPQHDVHLVVGGAEIPFAELAGWWNRYWAVQEPVSVIVTLPEPVTAGSVVTVEASAQLRIANAVVSPPVTPMMVESTTARTLTARAA